MSQTIVDNSENVRRMPPQAVEVEQAVLGAMMLDREAVGRAIELLDESYFYHGANGKTFVAMLSLYERGDGIDPITLAEELSQRNQLDEVGGPVYLADLATAVATAANFEYHAQIVRKKALGRKLIEVSAATAEQAYREDQDIEQVLDQAEQSIFALVESRLTQGFESLETVLDAAVEQIERSHRQSSNVTGVDTGFTELNDLTSGFQAGDMLILAARPSVGKTALALTMALHAAVETEVPVAIFSLEMAKMQLAQRLLCIQTRLSLKDLRSGRLSEPDWMNLTKSLGKLSQAPIFIDDTPGITILEARAKARRLQRDKGVGMVIIDYLQLMSAHERAGSREQEISQISRGIKGLAKELNAPVLALSQLSRAVESRSDRRPQLSDLRESGSIEQDADVVMFIYRPEIYGLKDPEGGNLEGFAELIVGKQRNGPTDSVQLMWNKECTSFETMAPDWRMPPQDEEI